jgi:hypothetical protein
LSDREKRFEGSRAYSKIRRILRFETATGRRLSMKKLSGGSIKSSGIIKSRTIKAREAFGLARLRGLDLSYFRVLLCPHGLGGVSSRTVHSHEVKGVVTESFTSLDKECSMDT